MTTYPWPTGLPHNFGGLEGEFAEGDTVKVDAADGELVFAKAAAGEAVGAST